MSEIKEWFKQWVTSGKFVLKKVKTNLSAGKDMVFFFLDCQRIIIKDYLETGKIITGAHCASLLNRVARKTSTSCSCGDKADGLICSPV